MQIESAKRIEEKEEQENRSLQKNSELEGNYGNMILQNWYDGDISWGLVLKHHSLFYSQQTRRLLPIYK